MKPRHLRLLPWLALPAVAVAFSGCQVVGLPYDSYTTVYGDYGYVGYWDQGPMAVGPAGYYAPPPYQVRDDDHRSDNDRRQDNDRRRDDDRRREKSSSGDHRSSDRSGSQQGTPSQPRPGPGQHLPPDRRGPPEQRGAPDQRRVPPAQYGGRERPREVPNVQRSAPPPRQPAYNIPSIPNNPRPAPERERNDKRPER